MGRRTWFRAISVLGGVLLALLAGEVVLRIYVALTDKEPTHQLEQAEGTMPPARTGACADAREQAGLGQLVRPCEAANVMYRLKSGIDTCYVGAPVRTNSAGFRASADLGIPKPADTYRYVLLGDSMIFGQGVEYADTVGEQLRNAVRQGGSGRAVEVLNTGVPGYNTAQQAAVLAAYGMAYEPDCVILLFIGNDFDLPEFLLKPRFALALDRSYLFDTIFRRRAKAREYSGGVIHSDLFFTEGRPPSDRIPDEYRHLVGEQGYRAALATLGRFAKDVPIVDFADYRPVANEANVAGLVEQQQRLGIIHPDFRYPDDAEYWLSATDHHLNPAGHRELARRMVAGLDAAKVCLPAAGKPPVTRDR